MTSLLTNALLILAAVALANAALSKLPSNFKTCKQTDPDYNECLKKAIIGAIPILSNGVQSLGVTPLDPLEITSLSIGQDDSRPVSINLDFKNIKIHGIKSGVIDSVQMKPGSTELSAKAHVVSPIVIEGPYKIDGKVLVLPIKGEGKCKLTLNDLVADLKLLGKTKEKDGQRYWEVQDFKFDFQTTKLELYFENLFNGDKALGDNMNEFLNTNWKDILTELKPAISAALGQSFLEMSRRVFDKVPYDSVFPPK